MEEPGARILYCHCANARVVPDDVKRGVLARLADSGAEFEAVPDLCEMSACKDPTLAGLAASGGGGTLRIAACYPRAVRWLFHAAGAPLPAENVHVFNMREAGADEVADGVLGLAPPPAEDAGSAAPAHVAPGDAGGAS